jgi:type II secretory pathway pseudopilin PulG
MLIKSRMFNQEGISLVEMLVISGLITIMISGFIALINPLQKISQSNDVKRKSDIAQLQRALEIYNNDNGQYPASTATYTITGTNWGGAWPQYMARLPQDPTGGRRYVYYTPNIGACANYQCYYIFASLQSGGNDPQACFPGSGAACTNAALYSLGNSCGDTCNYGVSSPNTSP